MSVSVSAGEVISGIALVATILIAILGGALRLAVSALERRMTAIETDSERSRTHREETAVRVDQATRDATRVGGEVVKLELRTREIERAQTEHSGEVSAVRSLVERLESSITKMNEKLDRLLGLDVVRQRRDEADRTG